MYKLYFPLINFNPHLDYTTNDLYLINPRRLTHSLTGSGIYRSPQRSRLQSQDIYHSPTEALSNTAKMISGLLFISWRIFEIIITIPILGMLAYFVHGYVVSNQLTPTFILVMFIVSVLAAVWAIATLFDYVRTRHHGLFVALVDLAFVGAFIAAVYELRGIANANCTNFTAGSIYVNLGPFGYYGKTSNSKWSLDTNKTCDMLKASFALGIIDIIAFFITFVSNPCVVLSLSQ